MRIATLHGVGTGALLLAMIGFVAPRAGLAQAPANVPPRQTQEEKVTNLLDYLEKDYAKKTAAPYWVTRAMGVISLARIPRPTATAKLLEVLEKDRQDVVRLLAWQALLARADSIDQKTYLRWYQATLPMADRGVFNGSLRIPLLHFLSTNLPNVRAKKVWQKIFEETNAWEPQDIAVLDALGASLGKWHSAFLADALVGMLSDPNHGVRAEYVLRQAGTNFPIAREVLSPDIFNPQAPTRAHPSSSELYKRVQAGAAAYFKQEKANWKEATKLEGEPWKELKPAYVPAPDALESIDPDDKSWTNDLELGKAELDQVEAAFVVDATGSMGDVLAWLKRDVARMASALTLICKEPPGLGLTFYRDQVPGEPWAVKHVPITYKLATLEPDLKAVTAQGGGDIPEVVLDALKNAIDANKWSNKKSNVKTVILIGDAPPKPGTETACNDLAKKAAGAGVRVHAVKVTTVDGRNDLSSFVEIATAGNGISLDVNFSPRLPYRYVGPDGKEIPLTTVDRPETQTLTAIPQGQDPPGEMILTTVIADAISPEYRNRVEPMARTLLAFTAIKSEPETRKPFPANTPPLGRANFDPQKK